MSLKAIFTDVEDFFVGAKSDVETALTALKAGAATANNFVGVVLGQVDEVLPVVTELNAPLGAAITAGVAAIQALQADIASGLDAAGADATALTSSLSSLQAQAVTLATQAAPFYKAVANDASAVSTAAVDAAAAVTGVVAPAAPAAA